MANLYSSVKAACSNYNRLVRIEEGYIPPPSYQRAEEVGVELVELPPPEPNPQEPGVHVREAGTGEAAGHRRRAVGQLPARADWLRPSGG